jgi:NADH:ubiquinone reductase (H+-translocating)
MKPYFRRVLIGAAAGLASCYPLVVTNAVPQAILPVASVVGAAFAAGLGRIRGAYAEGAMAGCALGIPLWILVTWIGAPSLAVHIPSFSADSMRALFPALVGWTLYGCLLGVVTQVFGAVVDRVAGPETEPNRRHGPTPRNIVILGGGFAGMTTAVGLEQELRGDQPVSVTLVSDQNALLFTPMLADVAGGSLEASHISAPLRTSLHRTGFVRGLVEAVDFERRVVKLSSVGGSPGTAREIPYDHLVLALGSVSNYFGAENIERHAFDFKTLLDASRIRNHVIEMFERADRESDPEIRRALVTFVVAGGGFAGVELAGAINDFARGISADYLAVAAGEIRILLVHSRDRILPELSESLAQYARVRMAVRGVDFRLSTRVLDAQPGQVTLSDGVIETQTLVWTAGTSPNPLLKAFGLETDKRGAVVVDSTMAVASRPGVWALGDCAAMKDGINGKVCPPTAQFALRQGRTLARNIHRAIKGKPLVPFHFDSLGSLCVVGHQTACAELTLPFARHKSLRFSGLLAWIIWRGIYVSKLPGLERKARVLLDWTFEIFFPRDIVQTIETKQDLTS